MTTPKAISVQGLTVFYDQNIALNKIDLVVERGDYLGIIGPNGGGKTTLLKAILGLIKPQEGTVLIDGKPLNHAHGLISYVPQIGAVDRSFPITVLDNVLFGLLPTRPKPFHRFTKKDIAKAMETLEKLGIAHLSKRHIMAMSGGEYQKSMIARAMISDPKILLLDEPTANVDQHSRADIYDLLHDLNQEMTIIIVTHDTLAISTYVKNLACLDQKLVYHGSPALVGDAIEHMYHCPIELIAHGHTPHRVIKSHQEDPHHD